MKKFLLSIFCCLVAVFAVQAEDVLCYTLEPATGSNNSYAGNCDITIDEITWNLTGNSTTNPWRIGGKSLANVDRALYSKTPISSAVSKVVLTTGTASSININSAKLMVANNADFSGAVEYPFTFKPSSNIEIPVSAAAKSYYKFVFNVTVSGSSNKYLQFTKAEFYATGDEEGGDTTNPVDVAEPTFTPADGATFDESLAVTITAEEGLDVYYSTDNKVSYTEGNAVNVTETTTVYAYAEDADGNKSDVVSATYTKNTPVTPPAEGEVVDVLTLAITGVTGTSYAEWSDKSVTSSAVYAGQSAGGNASIQLRTTNNNSGIVTTASGGKATKVVVVWNSNTTSGRTLNVYGKNSAYRAAADLYNTSTQGTLIGTIVYDGSSTTLNIDDDYEYIGLRSNSGAMYLTSVSITWDTSAGVTPVAPVAPILPAETTFTGSMSVEITGIAADATVYYTTDESDPATSATRVEYTEPFEITATTTVKAVAVNGEGVSSAVASSKYTKVAASVEGTVADAIAAYVEGCEIPATITGYIVGAVDGSMNKPENFTGVTSTATNILIADDANETNAEKCIPVQLSSGDFRTALNLAANTGNYKKKITVSGDLTAYFSVAGIKNVNAAGVYQTVSNVGWSTLYLGYNAVVPNTVKAYVATKVVSSSVILEQIEGTIDAETGVILEGAGEHLFSVASEAAGNEKGLLKGSVAAENVAPEGTAYVLSAPDSKVGLYVAQLTDGTFLNNANKAYLDVTNSNGIASYSFNFDWAGTTGIEGVTAEGAQDGAIYDITGRRVKAITAPGIYIVNGRKVVK